jgi:hypothetical protein
MFRNSYRLVIMLPGVLGLMASVHQETQAQGQVIEYEENFDNGAGIANYPDWEIGSANPGGAGTITQVIGEKVANVVDPGDGDFALLVGTAGGAFGDRIRVQNTTPFARGSDLVVTYKVWGDNTQSWGGAFFPTGAGILVLFMQMS